MDAPPLEDPAVIGHRRMRSPTTALVLWVGLFACVPRRAEEGTPPPMATLTGIRLLYYQGAELAAAGVAAQVTYERSQGDFVASEVALRFPSRREQPNSPGPAAGGMELRAPTVTGNLVHKQADGSGGAVLRTGSGIVARTERAHLDGLAMKASGKDPVWVETPAHALRAGGFSVQIGEEDFEFDPPVAVSSPSNRGEPDGGVKANSARMQPILIDSKQLRIEGKKQQALWYGHVKAVRGTTHLSCDRMLTHYTKTQQITRVECDGHVEVTDGDKWGRGEHADFDNLTGILVVTGSPEAKQGENHVLGTKVTFNVDKDTIEVENARALVESTPQGTPAVPRPEPKKEKSPR